MYKKGDIIKFKKSDNGRVEAQYDWEDSKDMASRHGFRPAEYLVYLENRGIVVLPTEGRTHTLVEYVDSRGKAGVLYFLNEDLELVESKQEINNSYEIY